MSMGDGGRFKGEGTGETWSLAACLEYKCSWTITTEITISAIAQVALNSPMDVSVRSLARYCIWGLYTADPLPKAVNS